MKTRTLLLLALGCGLMIMLAGAVFLFQLTTQDEVSAPDPLGEAVTVGDMRVTVEGADERGDVIDVEVVIGGVDDPDGLDGFRLIAGGRAMDQLGGDDDCASTSTADAACTLRFDLSAVDGTSRVLFYERGEDRARWVLA
jgi:hypothetical protein